MANHKSSEKRIRQTVAKRAHTHLLRHIDGRAQEDSD